MTSTEIKTEIQKVLDNVPEDALQDILHFLKNLGPASTNQLTLTHHLQQILKEDQELLKKLAQ
ncbi:hypothetical protein [uncultured Mucilaginibacter sp.]|uniref:hypothetical protein n=1 Tax=uncultured Mucilaginibacter sp. TaxID=797541 RepID=UPI00262FEB9F|nr:hypothetical protein [uncultured Mucilaginibacter sp.]